MLTVTAPAANRRLAAAGAVTAELGLEGSAGTARAGVLIDRASGVIAAFCGQDFALQGYEERFRCPREAGALILSRRPALVSSIAVDGAALAAADWECEGAAGVVYRLGALGDRLGWYGRDAVVAYRAGYVLPGEAAAPNAPALPSEVEQACILLCTSLNAGAGRDPLLRSENIEGVGSTSWLDPRVENGALPPQVAALLARHQRGMLG